MGYQIRNFSLECLTPVHIGSGVNMKRDVEFLVSDKDKTIGILDHRKVMDAFGEEKVSRETINKWVNAIDQQKSILSLLPSDIKIDQISKRVRKYNTISFTGDLREQMHDTQNNPIIPGSSIKGSVRTAIWDRYVKDDSVTHDDVFSGMKRGQKQYKDDKLIKEVFSPHSRRKWSDPNKDILRFLQITDVVFDPDQASCEVFKILSERNEGWKLKRFDENGECIVEGAVASGRIKIDERNLQNNIDKGYVKMRSPLKSIEDLFDACNRYTAKMLELELDFFSEELNLDNDRILYDYIGIIKSLLNEVKSISKNSCIVRMGHGTGYRFMTGNKILSEKIEDDDLESIFQSIRNDWRNRYRDYFHTKSRKLTSTGSPLGFVRLKMHAE